MRHTVIRGGKKLLCAAVLLGLVSCATEVPSVFDEGAAQFGEGKPVREYSLSSSGARTLELIDQFSGAYVPPSAVPMSEDDFDYYYDLFMHRWGGDDSETDAPETDAPETDAPETDAPETDAPETDAPETDAPETDAPETDAPETDAPETDPPETEREEPEVPAYKQVSDWNGLLRAFHDTYGNTEELIMIEFVNGYSCSMEDNLDLIYRQLQREDPIGVSCVALWSWTTRDTVFISEIEYSIEPDTLRSMKEATAGLAAQAASSLFKAGMTDYEAVCAVNDYLCDTVYYPPVEPYEPVTHTAYGALSDGCAVCEGYACAAKLMMNELGKECDIQVGECTNGGGHAWNLVKVDGDWYQWDVTWNDGGGLRDEYLLKTDAFMSQSRSWDTSLYPSTPDDPYDPN